MNKTKLAIIIIVVVILAGGAYWLSSNSTDTSTTPAGNLSAEPAAVLAKKDLAEKLGIDEKNISITRVTETTWNDGCLGLGGPAESCLQALTPGFKVEMQAGGKTYTYRTDKTGSAIRAESDPVSSPE